MNNTTTSQKIRADLTARLREAEAEIETKPHVDTVWLIGWLRRKLELYDGWHREYDRQNYPVQFEREPDEHLLDASDDTLSGSLKDAGFDSFGPM